MQDLFSSSLATTILTTTIAVVMAAIFFCCWGKKEEATDSVDAPDKSTAASKRGNKHHKKAQPNGNGSEVGGAVNNEQSPSENGSLAATKSPPEIVVDSDDLGDFSAVSRETEILRSYRKPPPPKNRARQSRAPRAQFKASTENLDIFTELVEESSALNDSTDHIDGDEDVIDQQPRPARISGSGSNNSSNSDHNTNTSGGSPLMLRPRIDRDDGGPKREDVRSSMLADIEQTLAALHSKHENKPAASGEETIAAAAKAGDGSSRNSVHKDVDEAPVVREKTLQVSSRPHSHLAESRSSDSSGGAAKLTPESQSPLAKPKVGPKVSPKPAVRKRVLVSSVASDSDTETQVLPTVEGGEGPSPKYAALTQVDGTSANQQSSIKQETELGNSLDTPLALSSHSSINDQEATDKDACAKTKQDNDTSDSASVSSDRDEQQDPTSLEVRISAGGEPIPHPQSTANSNEAAEVTSPAGEPTGDPEVTPDTTQPSTEQPPVTPDQEAASQEEITETPDSLTDTNNGENGFSEDEPKAKKGERQNSTEENSGGKGKQGSRIPVRAGSKPRSSPPKADTTENNN